MYDNYEHEIACPNNKGVRNYLWYDYFHDSTIYDITFNHKKELVTFTLECCRDIEEKWEKLKGDREIRRTYIDAHMDEFTYILTFKEVKYFHAERLIMVNDYINGRFKDTALLRKLDVESKKTLYHFRIQIDDGYIDIIFSDFQIRKKNGRVKYSISEITYKTEAASFSDTNAALIDGDFERFLAMQKFHDANDSSLLKIARENMRLEDGSEDFCLYSAYLLGKYGNMIDIPNLLTLYLDVEDYLISKSVCRCSALLPKRNILDAIELIQFRNK